MGGRGTKPVVFLVKITAKPVDAYFIDFHHSQNRNLLVMGDDE